ncbi:biotin/lipoyl-binding protein [Cereibacter changlensis]|uniref:biotin/lipoyl-binding protein n=1 Tax=Cereibacter changlensis TaxID=402884 RepID=UPI00200B3E30|nr:biotin/lipoyl-binding protein [Cereibacter changlensis]
MRVTSVLLALTLGLSGAGAAFAQTPEAAPQTLPAITVSTVAPRLMRDRVIASGLVEAVEMVQVQPLIEGQPIETLEADVGDMVSQGQVLARLSLSTLELQRSQFTASLASAKATIASRRSPSGRSTTASFPTRAPNRWR